MLYHDFCRTPDPMALLRLPVIFGLTFVGTIGALYGVASQVLLHSFLQVEQQRTQDDVQRVLELVASQQTAIFSGLVDYSSWDVTYAYAQGKKPDYTTVDLTDSSFTALNIDLAVISDAKNRILYSAVYDPQTASRQPLPASLNTNLTQRSVLQRHIQKNEPRLQFVMLSNRPVLVVSQPILMSEGQGQAAGSMMFGKYLDAGLLQKLSKLTRLSLELRSLDEMATAPDLKQIAAQLKQEAIVVQPLSDDLVAGYSLIKDIDGQPIFVLQAINSRLIYQQGLVSLRYLGITLSIGGALAGLVIWRLFQQSVHHLAERERIQQALQQETILRQADQKYREKAEELGQTLRELRQTQTQLIQNEKMSSLGQLVAGIAHEINNPVGFIAGNIDYAKSYIEQLLRLVELYQQSGLTLAPELQAEVADLDAEFLQDDLPKLMQSMKVGTERIKTIVLSLRNFSRLDEKALKAVDIHEGLDSTLLLLQNRLKLRGSQPDIQILRRYGDFPLVECYPSQLNQVFMNLLSNAIDAIEEHLKYRESEPLADPESEAQFSLPSSLDPEDAPANMPLIWIETAQLLDEQVVIRIGNIGAMIPDEIQKRLFEPFFTTKEVGKGTGLGLAISYQIVVEKHQGQLFCRNLPHGVEFVVQIPLQQLNSASAG